MKDPQEIPEAAFVSGLPANGDTAAATVTITLSFEGDTTADLDVFLIDAAVTTLYGYSVHDNQAAPKDQNERIKISNLPAGDYRIGVDAFLSPSGAVTYTLQLE